MCSSALDGAGLRPAIYARVSKDQADSRGRLQDPENQLKPLRKWAEALGLEEPIEYVDRVSGGSSDRPAFKVMMNKIRQGHHRVVLVWDLDRFSREGIVNTMAYIKQLRRMGVVMKALRDPWLDTSQEGVTDLILAVMAWAAAEESKKISDRTKAGLATAKRKGKILGRHPKNCECPIHRQKRPPLQKGPILYKENTEG